MIDTNSLTFQEIFYKIEVTLELTIVYVKPEMVPHLYEFETKQLHPMPDGYLEYDAKRFYRKAA